MTGQTPESDYTDGAAAVAAVDEYDQAVRAACEVNGYPWTVGVLKGALSSGWSIHRVTQFLSERAGLSTPRPRM